MSDRATRDWEHYSENVEAILTDLIAELREPVRERAIRYDEELAALADRAEARLREMTGDE